MTVDDVQKAGGIGVPGAVLRAFGSVRARPRVTAAYNPATGYVAVEGRPVLTAAVAERLRSEGYSTVRLRWRWRERTMSVLGPKNRHSVWAE